MTILSVIGISGSENSAWLEGNYQKTNGLEDGDMDKDIPQPWPSKPLAGTCRHDWQAQTTPYAVAELCTSCRLVRYKTSPTADWEYRAPIPIGKLEAG